MIAEPAPCMTDLTSAKSGLIKAGSGDQAVMPWTPDSRTWSAERKCVQDGVAAVTDGQQTVIRDDGQRVDFIAEGVDTGLGGAGAAAAFERGTGG